MNLEPAAAVRDRPCLPKSPATADVTSAEIAFTDRILQGIDTSNAVLGSISQWVLIWTEIRRLSVRYDASSQSAQAEVGEKFRSLIEEAAQIGTKLLHAAETLQITPEHLAFATGCSRKSLECCIEFLRDLKEKHFGEPVDPELLVEIWREARLESGKMVSTGH